jgi:hypothetical protein
MSIPSFNIPIIGHATTLPFLQETNMSVSDESKEAKVPYLVLDLQSICESLADAKRRYDDLKSQINSLEIGSFISPAYDTKIQSISSLKHVDGAMVDWTVGKLDALSVWWVAVGEGRMAAIDNLRTGNN